MKGIICMWSGAVLDIPEGWALCDGTQGTPDLRNRFIVGSGDTFIPGDSGGAISHRHKIFFQTGEGYPWLDIEGPSGQVQPSAKTHTHYVDGDSNYTQHYPPYYALCFIMKL